jgi:hypothetical protein
MKSIRYVYWKDDDMWLGYLEEFPDYMTQGKTVRELKENLKDIYDELTSGRIPRVRRVATLKLCRVIYHTASREWCDESHPTACQPDPSEYLSMTARRENYLISRTIFGSFAPVVTLISTVAPAS